MSVKNILTSPFKLLKELIFDVYMLSDGKKNVTYIAPSHTGITQYYVERLCEKDVKITKIKRIYFWELRKFVDQQDAVFVDIYRPLARVLNGGIRVPSLVNQVLDLDNRSLDDTIKIDKNNMKRVKKYKYENSNDPEDLKFFYEKIYVPHAKRRYGDFANIADFNNIEKIFKNGWLIFVTVDNERVAASLDEMIGNTYFLRKAGAIDDDFIKKGAIVASYYFSLSRAKDINAEIVDFGTSLPFLLNGALRHKNHWGTRIIDDVIHKRFAYLKNVLFEQPFICIENNKLKGIVFSENDKLIKEYSMSGLEFKVVKNDIGSEK